MTTELKSQPSHCQVLEDAGVHERYLAGSLPAEEAHAFEDHVLLCTRCQQTLEVGAAIRSAPKRAKSWLPRLIGAGTLAAAAMAAFLVFGPDRQVTSLGTITEPPIYLGIAVRSDDGTPEDQFERGMEHYNRGDYAAAVATLHSALDAGAPVPPTAFFLGAAQLLLDEPKSAAAAFSRVIGAGDSPYLVEARFYRAKAYLRGNRAGPAKADLRVVVSHADHPLAREARDLLAKVEN